MKSLFAAAFLVTLSCAQSTATAGVSYTPDDVATISAIRDGVSINSCEMYTDFNLKFDYCPKGYINDFAYPYCSAFLENFEKFDNKDWQNAVRTCLQNKLVDFAVSQEAYPSCQAISDAGFNSHQECYLLPNPANPELTWCNLSWSDMFNVAWIAKDAGLWEVLKEGVPVVYKCLAPMWPF